MSDYEMAVFNKHDFGTNMKFRINLHVCNSSDL